MVLILLPFTVLIFWLPLVPFGSNLRLYLFFWPIITKFVLNFAILPLKLHRIIFWLLDFIGFQKLLLSIGKPYVFPSRLGACQDGTLALVFYRILRPVF